MRVPSTILTALAAVAALTALGACARAPGAAPGAAGAAPSASGAPVALNEASADGWQQVGDARLYTARQFRDFVLDVDWRADAPTTVGGVLLRVPKLPAAMTDTALGGYEVRIAPDPARQPPPVDRWSGPSRERFARITGAVGGYAASWHPTAAKAASEWNHYRIEVSGQRYRVWLNGEPVNDFFGTGAREGYVGLHAPGIQFRDARVTPLTAPNAPERVTDLLRVTEQRPPIRVLVVTASQGFRHTEAIDASKDVLPQLQQVTEFRFDFTEDVPSITAEKLAGYDVLFLDNSTLRIAPANPGDSASVAATKGKDVVGAVTAAQQRAIRDFVRSGKGLAAAHSGVDALYGWPEYREMMGGGLFQKHPWTQPVQVNVEDRSSAIVSHFGPRFWLRDEIYVVDTNPRPNVHVLMSLDLPSTGPNAPAEDHPLAWTRRYGDGRVFVTVLGHFGDDWRRPDYLQHLLQGLRYAAGRLPDGR